MTEPPEDGPDQPDQPTEQPAAEAEPVQRSDSAKPTEPDAPPIRPEPRPIRGKVLGRQWPLGVVTAGLIGSLVVVVLEDFRPGALMFAMFVLLGAAFRLLLPSRRAGLLVLRSRALDVLVMTVLGLAIVVLAIIVPGRSIG